MMVLKRLERGWKRLFLAAVRPLTRPPRIDPGRTRDLRRILAVRHDHRLGNLVLVTPFLAELRRSAPAATVTFLAGSPLAEILRGHPGIDRLWIINKRSLIRNPIYLLRTLLRLRRERYDAAFDLSHPASFSLTGAFIVVLSGAACRIGFDRGPARSFFNLPAPVPSPELREFQAVAALIGALGVRPVPDRPRVYLAEAELKAADELLARKGMEDQPPLVAVHPGGRGRKQWGRRKFAALADSLCRRGLRVLLLLGPMEPGLPLDPGNKSRLTELRPRGVRELAALIARADLFVSGDTGPMHLAAAVGTRCLSIFTEPRFERYAPPGCEHEVMFDPDGRLAPETVAQAALRMVEPG